MSAASLRSEDGFKSAAKSAAVVCVAIAAAALPAADAEFLGVFARRLMPREKVRPSTWAEENVVLSGSQTEKPGPFRCSYLPWTRALHDRLFEHADKRGEIWIKPAQIGASRAQMNKLICQADTNPGKSLYLAESDPKVRKFATEEIVPVLRAVGSGRLGRAVAREQDMGRRMVMLSVPLPGGQIDLAGAGTESSVVGVAYRDVYVDEYELSTDNLPASSGDIWTSAVKRTTRFRLTGRCSAFGHPRKVHAGIHRLFEDLSDCGSWGFDCPHEGCGKFIAPRWSMVRYEQVRSSDGRPDPATAALFCPHCGAMITDEQRQRATWPSELRAGGSGRVESELPESEAKLREWLGIWITGLCDPYRTVSSLAVAKDVAERSGREQAVMDWWNKDEGEPFNALGDAAIRPETFESCVIGELPLLPETVEVITVGTDVQAPRETPTLVVGAYAWTRTGECFAVGLKMIGGPGAFGAYLNLLGSWRWKTTDGRELGVHSDAMDVRYEGGQVMDCLRENVNNGVGRPIARMAVGYEPSMKPEPSMRSAPERALYKPGRPDLGALDYQYLHRHTFIDRIMKLVAGGRFKVACEKPDRWLEQMTANVLRPLKKNSGFEPDTLVWEKPKEYRDDWLQTACYALAAAIRHGDFETLHLRTGAPVKYVALSFAPGAEEVRQEW